MDTEQLKQTAAQWYNTALDNLSVLLEKFHAGDIVLKAEANPHWIAALGVIGILLAVYLGFKIGRTQGLSDRLHIQKMEMLERTGKLFHEALGSAEEMADIQATALKNHIGEYQQRFAKLAELFRQDLLYWSTFLPPKALERAFKLAKEVEHTAKDLAKATADDEKPEKMEKRVKLHKARLGKIYMRFILTVRKENGTKGLSHGLRKYLRLS